MMSRCAFTNTFIEKMLKKHFKKTFALSVRLYYNLIKIIHLLAGVKGGCSNDCIFCKE